MSRSTEREQIARALDAAATARRLFPRAAGGGLDITSLQVLLALRVGDANGDSSEGIATRLELDPSTVSHALRELRRRGLVASEPDSRDSRRRLNRLTRSGRSLATSTVKAWTHRRDGSSS